MPRFENIDAVSRWILIGLMAFLPFLFVPVQWIDVVSIKVVAISLALVVIIILWMVARIMESAARIPRSIGIAAALTLPVAYALSVAVAGGGEVSLLGRGVETDTLAFVCLEFSAIALMALLFAGRVREILLSVYAFILGGAILALIEITHFLAPSLSLGGVLTGQTGNAFGSWHAFAMMMGLMLLLAVGFASAPFVRGWWRIILYLLAVLAIALLTISSFTDVWIGVLLGALALPALRAWQSRHFSLSYLWHKERIPLTVAAMALVLVIFGGSIQSVLPSRIQVAHVEVRPSWSGTLSIARQSLATPRAMLFGTGPNTFTRQWGLHKPSGVNQTPFWNNDFRVGIAPIPTSLITVGAIGLLAWAIFSVAILWLVLSLIRLRLEPAAAFIATTLSVALLYLLGMQVFSMPGPVLSLLLFLFAGMLIALRTPRYDREIRIPLALSDWSGRGSIVLSIIAVVFVLAAGTSIIRVNASEALVNRGAFIYNSTTNATSASASVAAALRIFPSDRAHRAAVELGLLELQILSATTDPSTDAVKQQLQATLQKTIAHGLEAVSINSYDYQNWLELASLYSELAGASVQGAYEVAQNAYARAADENPNSPLPFIGLAQLERLQGNASSSLAYLAKAVQIKPDFAAAYYLASQVYASQGEMASAASSSALAAQYAPNDPQAWYNLGIIQYASGNDATAQLALRQSLSLNPKFANAMYVLGLSYYRQGDAKTAISTLEALDQLDPGHPAVQQLLENLRSGIPFSEAAQNGGT